jgi:hypothetical protein
MHVCVRARVVNEREWMDGWAALISKAARQLKAWVGDAQRKAEAAARSRRGPAAAAGAAGDGAGDAAGAAAGGGGGEQGGGGGKAAVDVPQGRHTLLTDALRKAGMC